MQIVKKRFTKSTISHFTYDDINNVRFNSFRIPSSRSRGEEFKEKFLKQKSTKYGTK